MDFSGRFNVVFLCDVTQIFEQKIDSQQHETRRWNNRPHVEAKQEQKREEKLGLMLVLKPVVVVKGGWNEL